MRKSILIALHRVLLIQNYLTTTYTYLSQKMTQQFVSEDLK